MFQVVCTASGVADAPPQTCGAGDHQDGQSVRRLPSFFTRARYHRGDRFRCLLWSYLFDSISRRPCHQQRCNRTIVIRPRVGQITGQFFSLPRDSAASPDEVRRLWSPDTP